MKRPKPSHRRRQFWLLTRRYLELLRNDRGNLAILLLQAPVIGLLLILFVVGISTNNFAPKSTGGFDPKNVVQCPTTAAVLTPAGYPDLPTPYNPAVSRSCQQLETFLKDKPRGKAYAATKKGGAREALLEAADSAMYQDKFTRRRIYQADVEMATPQARSSVSEDQEHTAEGMAVQALMAVTTVCHRAIAAHGQRMVHLAEATARKLERPREEIHLLRLAALLHDIGKIGIPDAVLHKPAPLTKAEWSMIHRHPAIGCQILEQIGGVFGQLAPIVEAHHERWDGGGYPHGLAQEAIPVGARILAVVDSYDAMTSPRPYGQEPLTVGEARAELQRGTGSQYDPRVGEAFLRVLEQQEDTQNPLEGSKAPGPSDRANPSSDLVPTSNEGPAVEAAFAEFPARSKEHGNGHTSRAPTGHLQQQSGDSSG